jgi:hypothetical protein
MQSCTSITTIANSRRATLLLGFALAGSLFATAVGPAPEARASQFHPVTRQAAADHGALDAERAADVRAGLELIASIPDDVLAQGDEATGAWFREHGREAGDDERLLHPTQANVLGCAAAIATVIASTAFPAAKILKIKKLIGELGGVAKAVQIFWGASFSYEKLQAVGGAALALAGELIGITSIQEECFS